MTRAFHRECGGHRVQRPAGTRAKGLTVPFTALNRRLLPPERLYDLEQNKQKCAGRNRHREIVHVERPEAKECLSERPKEGQAQNRCDGKEHSSERPIRALAAVLLTVATV